MSVEPGALHQRIGVVFGSRNEVERIEGYHTNLVHPQCVGTAGDITLADLSQYLGIDKGELAHHDVALVDATGASVTDPDLGPLPRPSAEAAFHARVVRLTGAGAVVHVHTVAAVVASAVSASKAWKAPRARMLVKAVMHRPPT